jgi:hypothetical protein
MDETTDAWGVRILVPDGGKALQSAAQCRDLGAQSFFLQTKYIEGQTE